MVIFRTKKKWSFKTGDLLKEVQFILNFLWQGKKKVTSYYRWLLIKGDCLGRFDCMYMPLMYDLTTVQNLNLFNNILLVVNYQHSLALLFYCAFMLSFSVWSFCKEANMCMLFFYIICLYLYCYWRSNYQKQLETH